MSVSARLPTLARAAGTFSSWLNGRGVRRAIFALAAVAFVVGLHRARDFFHDDAYISLRYVTRLLGGRGLTWTDGEPVEGFTHPLWIVQLVLLGIARVPLEPACRALGVLYAGATLVMLMRSRLPAWVALLVASHPAFTVWSLSGLETTSFAFFCVAGTLHLSTVLSEPPSERDILFSAAYFSAAALTRPDGVAPAGLAMALLLRERGASPRTRGAALALFAVPLAAHEVFRVAYYGDIIPNSVRAKTEGVPMGLRLELAQEYLVSNWRLWVPIALLAAAALVLSRGARVSWILLLALSLTAPIVVGGGDHMIAGRFILAGAAVAAVFAGVVVARAHPAVQSAFTVVVPLVAAYALATAEPVKRDPAAARGIAVGRFLEKNLPAGSLVAVSTAGSTPWAAPDLRFIDTLGLNDRTIARRRIERVFGKMQRMPGHFKGDGAYVLSREPDVILLGGALGIAPIRGHEDDLFLGDLELLASPSFLQKYQPFLFRVSLDGDERKYFDGDTAPIVAFLRVDSPRAAVLRRVAKRPIPTWE